jgi:AsmA protein
MSRRLRITLIATAGTLLALVATALVLAFVMLRPERFTRTLRASARSAGLELNLTAPAHPTLWPRPGVRLQGLQLFVQGQPYPLLVADSGRIVVPWRTVLGGDIAITTLELDAPRLDLGQLQRALSTLPDGNGKAPGLPRIDTGITIRNGALVHDNQLLLQDIDLHTGALMPDHRFTLDAQAHGEGGQQGVLKLQFTPRAHTDEAIALDDLRLDAHAGKIAGMQLDGRARWSGGAKLDLHLTGHLHPDAGDEYAIAVQTDPPPAPPGSVHLKVDGKAAHADLHLSPRQVSEWWQRMAGKFTPGALPPPPLKGSIDADELDFGSIRIKGLKVRSTDTTPAAAGSAPATAEGAAK